MFEPCSCSAIWDFVCEETLDSERIGESTIVGVGVQGLIMVRLWRETHRHGSNCALGSLRYQGLVRHGVLCSPRVRAALSSGGKKEMTGRALAGSTRSTRATPSSLLTGTDIRRKMAGGYIVRGCSTDEATTKDEV